MSEPTPGSEVLERVRQRAIPRHVAVIMDGNGRWAAERGLPRWEGHRAGMSAVREIIEGAAEAKIAHLTLYAFSQENWQRPESEVSALMSLLEEYVVLEKEELVGAGIRVNVFGNRERLSPSALAAIEALERATGDGEALFVHLAISYGSRAEIVRACRTLAQGCVEGTLAAHEITEDRVGDALLTREWPDPDLLIRTSGEWRISNFLLWQLAYAEIYVTPILWPDFRREHLFEALIDYQGRQRRFGKVAS